MQQDREHRRTDTEAETRFITLIYEDNFKNK